MTALLKIADTEHCLAIRHGIGTVDAGLATARCLGVALQAPCKSVNCPGIALRELGLEHHALEQRLRQLGAQFTANMQRRGQEPYSELWVHGPFPSKNLRDAMVDSDSPSMFGKVGRRTPDPRAGGLPVENPELTLPAVFETTDYSHLRDYQFIGWFHSDEQTISTRGFWTGDRSGFERQQIGATE